MLAYDIYIWKPQKTRLVIAEKWRLKGQHAKHVAEMCTTKSPLLQGRFILYYYKSYIVTKSLHRFLLFTIWEYKSLWNRKTRLPPVSFIFMASLLEWPFGGIPLFPDKPNRYCCMWYIHIIYICMYSHCNPILYIYIYVCVSHAIPIISQLLAILSIAISPFVWLNSGDIVYIGHRETKMG
jgi:hypothetical protein